MRYVIILDTLAAKCVFLNPIIEPNYEQVLTGINPIGVEEDYLYDMDFPDMQVNEPVIYKSDRIIINPTGNLGTMIILASDAEKKMTKNSIHTLSWYETASY